MRRVRLDHRPSGSAGAASARPGARSGEAARRRRSARRRPARSRPPARPIAEVDVEAARARPTGVDELDRVLGGGLVPGAVVLLAGEPGVGKSTLLLDVAARFAAARPARALRHRRGVRRPGAAARRPHRRARATTCSSPPRPTWPPCSATSTRSSPTCWSSTRCRPSPAPRSTAPPAASRQVREVAAALIRVAKERGIATVLVGHVTKDGSIAGPRLLEHLVDVVLHFEGDRHSRLRMVRGGEEPVRPGRRGRLLRPVRRRHRRAGRPERAVPVPARASRCRAPASRSRSRARRPLVAEVQALVAPSTARRSPRRTTSGLDGGRVAMVLAVLQRRAGVTVGTAATSTPRPSAACG